MERGPVAVERFAGRGIRRADLVAIEEAGVVYAAPGRATGDRFDAWYRPCARRLEVPGGGGPA
ncbi:hypothetical protein J2S43_003566 [Catenuloplanes nepalensis]|uniref:Uncharacterized protein n=1 Tax=Catenuloplanes nepalensis TaxID=587533 RepID=A0ABT9MUF7_9ACTN|nr:hypothetical protein [Catenuloplanes nepalensis]MDP9795054.1 hypothetical protein [Catenuloplanes nepalensis]